MHFYTSDLHLGHENIIKLCKRPFFSLEEMNETLIDNWNSRVTNADNVYMRYPLAMMTHCTVRCLKIRSE